jgi:hypothetical protein
MERPSSFTPADALAPGVFLAQRKAEPPVTQRDKAEAVDSCKITVTSKAVNGRLQRPVRSHSLEQAGASPSYLNSRIYTFF